MQTVPRICWINSKHDYMQTEHCQTNVQVTHDNDTLAEM